MATYAIGDIQGCYHSFRHLLKTIAFNETSDHLWLVGDLINRGAGSLEVLRWLYAFDRQYPFSLVALLGNHDLHSLVVAEGFVSAHKGDTLQALLDAPDRDTLLAWLRYRPMIHANDDYLMVHAGLLPQWTASEALALGREVETALRADDYRYFLARMYGNLPNQWHADLTGMDRLRLITNAMTRLRVCTLTGEMQFTFKGELADIPADHLPWFDVPTRRSADTTVLFGHWSALGLRQRPHLFALDTGCLWGGQLTALRLEDRQIFQVPCSVEDAPRKIRGK